MLEPITAKNKIEVKPSEIGANIYDWIELIIDINGVTDNDIITLQNDIDSIFINNKDMYVKEETGLNEFEINNYIKRNLGEISPAAKKRMIERDVVTRYSDIDNSRIVTISRAYISVKLFYVINHKLKDNIVLIQRISECFNKIAFYDILRVTLIKVNKVVCTSLYKLYQCLNRFMFGDVGYSLSRRGKKVDVAFTSVNSEFECNFSNYVINKSIKQGMLNEDKRKFVYEGILGMQGSYESNAFEDVEVNKKFVELNDMFYLIFLEHITSSFLLDMINGETTKVLRGFKKNGIKQQLGRDIEKT
ncbi:hypothetical protein [[Clostridium] fimetarium]|uniref:Uncharacterized protein n=1 Tax=[Clostridium] fimetarium TaxID=99656 RepID=A0A1I0QV20_9FIRM|nr:hypothetical protein [[Clostridium] fimetarium]SEW31484.1 hypothetical protein SAMN05421659_109152 [[Clostridium] fimetarium]